MELIFVYNADNDLFSKVTDYAHKILRPKSYPCTLCAITHGNFGMKRAWADFINELNLKTSFYHKDQFAKKYPKQNLSPPAIFLKVEDEFELIFDKTELAEIKNLEVLISGIKMALIKEA